MEDMSNKVKIVSFIPLTLYKDKDDDRYASLSWSIRMGYPRITVYTDNDRKRNSEFSFDKLITAPLTSITVNVFIDNMLDVIKSDKESKFVIACYNNKYVNNVRTDETYIQAKIVGGRDKDGVIYIAAIADDKDKIKFELLPNKWHVMLDSDGNKIEDKQKLSTMFAKAYIGRLKVLMDKHLTDDGSTVKYTDRKTNTSNEGLNI